MKIGIVNYQIAYNSSSHKVCISTTDIRPAPIRCYTRDEIVELIALTHSALKQLYEMALGYFPAAHGNGQS